MTDHACTQRSRLVPALALLALLALVATACGAVTNPDGWAAPHLQGDTLYLSPSRGTFAAYRLDAGLNQRERLWLFPEKDERSPLVVQEGKDLAVPKQEKLRFEGFYGDPVVTSDGVYLTAYAGYVVALTTEGRPRWVAGLPGRMIGGALVTEDTVYAASTTGDLFALARDSGRVRWRAGTGAQVWSAPVRADDLIIVTSMDGSISAFTRDGERRWSRRVAGRGIPSTPTLDGNRLYASSFDRRLYALDARTGEELWRSKAADNWFWTEIVLQGDTLFAGSLGGTVYAVSTGDGTFKWSTSVGKMVRSKAVLAGGVLVVATKDGRLHGLRPGDGTRVWGVSASPGPDDPTASRGSLYADLVSLDGVVLATRVSGKQGNVYLLDIDQRRVREITPR